jgi:diguanylate cyclase (GGDEF)-like protein
MGTLDSMVHGSRGEHRVARPRPIQITLLVIIVATALIAAPSAASPWQQDFGFIPVMITAAVLAQIITVILLAQQYLVEGRGNLLAATAVFTWSALALLTVMLTFPGLLSEQGIDGPTDLHVWLWTLWHAAFPLSLGILAITWDRWRMAAVLRGAVGLIITIVLAMAVHGVVLAAIWSGALPQLLIGEQYTSVVLTIIHPTTLVLACIGMLLTWSRRDDEIISWFSVASAAVVAGIALAYIAGQRLTVGWYLGRVYVSIGALIVLVALLGRVMRLQRLTLTRSQALLTQAESDPLTGILNRRALDDRMHALAHTRPTLALIDCDRFKVINDTFGHGVGDEFLVALAGRLRGALRQGDDVVRWGGDEFLIVINDAPETGVEGMTRIHREVGSHPIRTSGHLLPVLLSSGVARWERGENFQAVLRRADAALYAAKKSGGNSVAHDVGATGRPQHVVVNLRTTEQHTHHI